ncbi:hypothetical protein [Nocardia vermiculata]|uniref:Secreted protein n=1 Tax=Nocardia vermiculata TaxID=257274 RepID=A0A846XXD2_9NOCA|nr:hypothetical protein [Nocardia vermiculata]NKY51773.1 hypothetical protein [Nocardia vermiculata]
MIRTAGLVTAAVAAGVCAVLGAGAANAAQGVVTVNGQEYIDPSGCIEPQAYQLTVGNSTDKVIEVHAGRGCTGPVIGKVDPAGITMVPHGSLLIVE